MPTVSKGPFALTRKLLPAVILALTTDAIADPMQLNFSADLYAGEFLGLSSGDTISGFLSYDSDTPAGDAGDDWAAFWDGFASYPAQLYIEQLDEYFDIDYAELYGDGRTLYLDGYGDSASIAFSIGANEEVNEALFLAGTGQLPTAIEQTPVGAGEVSGYIDAWSEGESALLHFNELYFESTDPEIPGFPELDAEGNLFLGRPGFANNAQINNGDTLTTTKAVIGYSAYGSFVQAGGTHNADELSIAGDPDNNQFVTPSGSYTLAGGNLTTNETQVGYEGRATFTQTGGTHTVDRLMLGNVGYGGPVNGPTAAGIGTYNLSAGTLTASTAAVGAFGQGTFNQTGGTVTVGETWHIPNALTSLRIGGGISSENPADYSIDPEEQRRGTYNLTAGTLTVRGNTVVGEGSDSSYYAYGALGYFNQSGGTFTSQGNLVLGEAGTVASGAGYYTLSGGSLNASGRDILVGVATTVSAPAKSVFTQTGGTVTADQIIIGDGTASSPNQYRVLGGTTTANGIEVGNGLIENGRAILEVSNGGQVNANVRINEHGIVKGTGGTIVGDVTLAGGVLTPGNSPGAMTIEGDLLVNDGILQLEYDGPGLQDLLTVTGDVVLGAGSIEFLLGFAPTETLVLENFFANQPDFILQDEFDPLTQIFLSFTDNSLAQTGDLFSYSFNGQVYQYTYTDPSEVPLPAAAWLMLSGLAGLAGIGRMRRAA